MGIPSIIIGGISAAASIGAGFLLANKQTPDKIDGEKKKANSFNAPSMEEGRVIPVVFGKNVRVSPSVIGYQGFETQDIKEKAKGGGKGFGGSSGGTSIIGYKSFIDMWFCVSHAIGGMTITVNKYIVGDKEKTPNANITNNNGTESFFPLDMGSHANKLKGICHSYFGNWNFGENTTTPPPVDFEITSVLPTTINNANMGSKKGVNPATIIYIILLDAGFIAGTSGIVLSSFNNSADYWYDKGHGLNIVFDSISNPMEAIKRVFEFVDGTLYKNGDGLYILKAFEDSEPAVRTIEEKDFIELDLEIETLNNLNNKFFATYTDIEKNHTEKSLLVYNPSSISQIGIENDKNIDLTAFTDKEIASKRLFEIMRVESIPNKKIGFSVDMRFFDVNIGDIVTINHGSKGWTSLNFRILSKTIGSFEEAKIDFQGELYRRNLFGDNHINVNNSSHSQVDLSPVDLDHRRVFELPYNSDSKENPSFIVLAQKKKGSESGYKVLTSAESSSNFIDSGLFTTWSQRGTLVNSYSSSSNSIDDSTSGILYTPSGLENPSFDSISRQNLFSIRRVAIINNEIVAFQNYTVEGGNIRLTGIIRGVLGSIKSSHGVSDEIWLTDIDNNILNFKPFETTYFQILPIFGNNELSPPATIESFTYTGKAKQPFPVGRVEAIRSGSNITVNILPATPSLNGAGSMPENVILPVSQVPYLGDFEINYDSNDYNFNDITYSFTRSGSFTLTVKSRLNGFLSTGKSVTVGAGDGSYFG